MNVVKPVFLPVLGVLGMAAVLLSLCGCGGGSGSDPAAQTVTTTGRFEPLAFMLTTRSVFQQGEPVLLIFTVTNTSSKPVSYTVDRSGTAVIVSRGSQEVLSYRPLNAGVYIPPQQVILDGGETRTFTERWNQQDNEDRQVPPGKYSIRVFLDAGLLDGKPVPFKALSAEPVEVTIR